MRLFLGLKLPTAAVRAVDHWREHNPIAAARAVPLANLHVTVAFLGEVDARRLEPLCDEVGELLEMHPVRDIRLHFDCVGYWPGPKVFWLGTSLAPDPELAAWAQGLQQLAGRHGNRIDRRPWTPHITLYRAVAAPPSAPSQQPDIVLQQDHLTLFESLSGRDGVRYEALGEWSLSGR